MIDADAATIQKLQDEINALKSAQNQMQERESARHQGPIIYSREYCSYCHLYGDQNWKLNHTCMPYVEEAKDANYKRHQEMMFAEHGPRVTNVTEIIKTTPEGVQYSTRVPNNRQEDLATRQHTAEIDAAEKDRLARREKIIAEGATNKK